MIRANPTVAQKKEKEDKPKYGKLRGAGVVSKSAVLRRRDYHLEQARGSNTSVLAFVNGVDRERSNFAGAIESISSLGIQPAIVAFPIGEQDDLAGVIDVLHMKAVTPDGEAEIPADLAEEARSEERV